MLGTESQFYHDPNFISFYGSLNSSNLLNYFKGHPLYDHSNLNIKLNQGSLDTPQLQ